MKVLVCGSLSSSLWRFRGEFLKALKKSGHEVIVAAPLLTSDRQTQNWLDENDIKGFDIDLKRTALNPVSDIKVCYQLWKITKNERVEVFIGYTIKPVIWGILASWLGGVSKRVAIITGLGYAFTGEAKGRRAVVQWLAKLLYKSAFSRATHVFFQNPDDRDNLSQLNLIKNNTPVKVVNGSGVDIDYFSVADFEERKVSFVLVARMLGDKGIREFVAAAKNVKETHSDCEFHLVGGVDDNPDAIKKQEILHWESQGIVKWHGNVGDVRPYLKKCHVYVLPSYREGTPRSVLEAMSMGRAVITTDAPGCRETVIDGENGFLVRVAHANDIAEAMQKFIENRALIVTMGKKSREIAVQKYDVHKVNAEMLEFLEL